MIIGTRESKLAMRQTEIFEEYLKKSRPDINCQIKGLTSFGDADQISPLNSMGDIGVFVRELDDALLRKDIDVSVNSMKDIPIDITPGLVIGAILPRDDVNDIIIPCSLDSLPPGSKIGTSSVRREHILKSIRSDIEILPIRGNIHTRLNKLDTGEYDAIILAKAGLDRMNIDRPYEVLDLKTFIPAPAQGAIAIECRLDDENTLEILKELDDPDTRTEVTIERSIMKLLGAGCSSPVGINAKVLKNKISVNAISFTHTETPVMLQEEFDYDDIEKEIKNIANKLKGVKQ